MTKTNPKTDKSVGKGGAYPITPAVLRQRSEASLKHGAYATKTAVQLRQRRLRHRVNRLRQEYPHLAKQPRHLVLRYVEIDHLSATLWERLAVEGPVNDDGEPKRLLTEYRHLLAELGRLAATLGLTTPQDNDNPF